MHGLLKKIIANTLVLSITIIFLIVMLFSCGNDIETINQVPVADTTPVEIAKEVRFFYSENGKIKVYMETPLLYRYEGENPRMVLPSGLFVIFYDSLDQPSSSLAADYGIRFSTQKIMEVKYNVIVHSSDSKTLYTEHLIWKEAEQLIMSEAFVKITSPDKILFGEGFVSDERFENYEIKKPKGEIKLNKPVQ